MNQGVKKATARRELSTYRAVVNYRAKEGYLVGAPIVSLPDKPETQERWLTRQQVAVLLWACRSLRVDGRQQLQRFILFAAYTGTRKRAALALGIDMPRTDSGWTPHQIGAWTGHESLQEIAHYTRDANKKALITGKQTGKPRLIKSQVIDFK